MVDLITKGTGASAVAALQDNVIETGTSSNGIDTLKLRGISSNSVATTLGLSLSLENLDASATQTSLLNLTGNAAANVLTGNNANNVINGDAGVDTMTGGGGNDVLYGGTGNDTLTGGTGADYFIFNTALDAATNMDIIVDFSVVDDTIRLENGIMTGLGLTTGTLAEGAFHSGIVNFATQADDRIIYNTSTGALFYDVDGTGATAAVQIALIGTTSHAALAYEFFEVI